MYVCVREGGGRACEHTNALRGRTWLWPKRHQSIRCRLKITGDPPPGAQATSGFVLSLSLPDLLEDVRRSPHSCAWIQGNLLKDFWGKKQEGKQSRQNHTSKPRCLGVFRVECARGLWQSWKKGQGWGIQGRLLGGKVGGPGIRDPYL